MNYGRMWAHDYRGRGFYMVTFSTRPRRCVLSSVEGGRTALSPVGEAVRDAWLRIPADDPAYSLRVYAVMPDHFHGVLVCGGGASLPLGALIRRMKGRSRAAARRLTRDKAFALWEDDFHDLVAMNAEELEAFTAYVRDNPLRLQLRREHPEWFRGHVGVAHPRLPPETGWTAYGDQTILDYPWLEPVVVSRSVTDVARYAELARQGAVLVSGCISPGERAAMAEAAANPRARLVRVLPWGLARYKPSGTAAARRLAEGRALVLSGFPPEVPQEAVRGNCLRNNGWVCAICGNAPQAGLLPTPRMG